MELILNNCLVNFFQHVTPSSFVASDQYKYLYLEAFRRQIYSYFGFHKVKTV